MCPIWCGVHTTPRVHNGVTPAIVRTWHGMYHVPDSYTSHLCEPSFQWGTFNQSGGGIVKNEHTFKTGDRVRTVNTFEAGVVHRVVDTPDGAMCHVYVGRTSWQWEPVTNLRCANHEKWGRYHMVLLYGKRYPVLHINATGHDIANIKAAERINRCACHSTYVHHVERVRKTRHRHPVGTQGMFRGKSRYIGQYDSDGFRKPGAAWVMPTPRPCVIVSHDVRHSWSGYTNSAYTVRFADGSVRSYVMGSQFRPE